MIIFFIYFLLFFLSIFFIFMDNKIGYFIYTLLIVSSLNASFEVVGEVPGFFPLFKIFIIFFSGFVCVIRSKFTVYVHVNNKTLCLFLIFMMLSSLYSEDFIYSILTSMSFFIIFLFFSFVYFKYGSQFLKKAIIYGVFLFLLFCWVIYLYYSNSSLQCLPLRERSLSFGVEANVLGLLAALLAMVTLTEFSVTIKKSKLLILIFALITLLASYSRTSIVGFFVFLFVYFYKNDLKCNVLLFFSSILLLVLHYYVNISYILYSMFNRTGSVHDIYNFTGRTEIWQYALESLSGVNILIGYGYASSKFIIGEGYVSRFGWTTNVAHNMWLQIAIANGLIGIVLFSKYLFTLLKRSFVLRDRFPVAFISFLLVHGMMESGPFTSLPGVYVLILYYTAFTAHRMDAVSRYRLILG